MIKVYLRQANRFITASPGTTILNAVMDAGIDFPHSCCAGNCGTCKSRLVSGTIEHLPHSEYALSAEERKQGFILACRSALWEDVQIEEPSIEEM